MKLGVYIHLGSLRGGNWEAAFDKAKALRDAGVHYVFACNAPVDTIAVAKNDTAALKEWASVVNSRLAKLAAIGMTCGVRPVPWIAEQVVIEQAAWAGIIAIGTPATLPGTLEKVYLPDFTIRRTSIAAAKAVSFDHHYLYAGHEVHKVLDAKMRAWVVGQLGPRTIFYYGHLGLWKAFGEDFGPNDLPHVVHVALNAAGPVSGPIDESATGGGIVVPRDCTAKQIGEFCESLTERLPTDPVRELHCHINVTEKTSVARMVAMVCVAREELENCWPDVLMFRNVDDKGNTVHEVPANVLEAIKELEGVDGELEVDLGGKPVRVSP